MTNPAISAYRNAIRATSIAFRQDRPILQAARTQIKTELRNNKSLSDKQQIEEAVTKLEEVNRFLISNVVQGEKQQDGKYFLNFHEKTELGDNETIKQGNKLGSLSGKKSTRLGK